VKRGKYQAQHDSLVMNRFLPFPFFPFHAKASKRFQPYLGPSAPLVLNGVRNFATIPNFLIAMYVKMKDFLVYVFVAQLLINF
jgi:hypothetical protein